jgi:hypothetical protein
VDWAVVRRYKSVNEQRIWVNLVCSSFSLWRVSFSLPIHSIKLRMTAPEPNLEEVYAFTLALAKEAGQMILDGSSKRTTTVGSGDSVDGAEAVKEAATGGK